LTRCVKLVKQKFLSQGWPERGPGDADARGG